MEAAASETAFEETPEEILSVLKFGQVIGYRQGKGRTARSPLPDWYFPVMIEAGTGKKRLYHINSALTVSSERRKNDKYDLESKKAELSGAAVDLYDLRLFGRPAVHKNRRPEYQRG